jgi:putative aminopeptidase FrvX
MNGLKELCLLNGVSGDEGKVRSYVLEKIKGAASEITVDPLGNIIAFKKGKNKTDKKILLCAHMDEVGFIIKSIDDEGYLRFETVGGIDGKVLLARRVAVGNGVKGVIGVKAVHLQSKEERGNTIKTEDMYIDIGAKNKEEAQGLVKLGDYASFYGEFTLFGDGRVCSKALDDRCGVNILISLINSDLPTDTYFAFTVQEEVGLRGATAAAHNLSPDIVLTMETTTAADFEGVPSGSIISCLGGGCVLSVMDRSTIYSRELFQTAKEAAEELGIKYQIKRGTAGGNDSAAMQKFGGGAKVMALSVPCRYIHSQNSVISIKDYESAERLALGILNKLS